MNSVSRPSWGRILILAVVVVIAIAAALFFDTKIAILALSFVTLFTLFQYVLAAMVIDLAEDHMLKMAKKGAALGLRSAKAERALDRVIEALGNHPRVCDVHGEEDPVSCGWKFAVKNVQDVVDEYQRSSRSI